MMNPSKLSQRESRNNTMSVVSSDSQHDLPLNFVRIDKGKLLAPNGNHAKKNMAVDGADFLVNNLLDKFQDWMILKGHIAGSKGIRRLVYMVGLSMLLASAKEAGDFNKQVIIGRKHGKTKTPDNPLGISAKTTNKLLKFLSDQNLVTYIVGKNNQYDANASWFIPLPNLLKKLAGCKVYAANGNQVVVCRERKAKREECVKGENWKKPPRPPLKAWTQRFIDRKLDKLSMVPLAYNEMMAEHSVRIGRRKHELLTHLYRSFTESEELGGRFYSPWQQTKKADRAKIRIDGSATVELDYKSLHWNMIYAEAGLQLEGDPYLVDGYGKKLRDLIKLVSLIFLNTGNQSSLAGHITTSGQAETQALATDWDKQVAHHRKQKAASWKTFKLKDTPKVLEHYIEGIPLGTDGTEVVAAILEGHPKEVRELLGTTDIGLRLQRKDSDIMEACIAACTAENIPTLTLHDSLICKKKDRGRVYGIMRESYELIMGKTIEIEEADKLVKEVKNSRNVPQKSVNLTLF
jgi:hypothetical protein